MLFQRVAYGALAIGVLLAVVLLDVAIARRAVALGGPWGALLRRGSTIPLGVFALTIAATFELNRFFVLKGVRPFRGFAAMMVGTLVLSPWFAAAGWLGTGASQVEGLFWPIALIYVAITGAGLLVLTRREPAGGLRDFGATVAIILYVGFLAAFAVQLRCGTDMPGESGAWLFLIALLVTKSSDIGAFFTGRAVGRHPLAPAISPAKTIEGAVGGLAASAAVAMGAAWLGSSLSVPAGWIDAGGIREFCGQALGLLLEATRCFATPTGHEAMSPIARAACFGLILSFAGQFGDLLESSFKRDAQVKDSGEIMPRFGGILDLIDSPMVALPVAWVLLTAIWGVV